MPLVAIGAADILLYSAPPNSVLPTTAAVAVYTTPLYLWLALSFFNNAAPADRDLLASDVGSGRAAWARLLGGTLLATVSAVASTAFPALAGRYTHAPSAEELALCAAIAITTALAATGLAALLAEPTVRTPGAAALALAVGALAAVPLDVPPIPIARAAGHISIDRLASHVAPDLGGLLLFAAAAMVAASTLWIRVET